jgi:prephenate dehydrogenase
MSQNLAVVHGTGLIGASLGLVLRSQGWTVRGWDPDRARLAEALRRGALDGPLDAPDRELDHADLVVLAGPPETISDTLGSLRTQSLVTDVAGVKTPIVAAASRVPRFVGGHPMAGGTTTGPALATSTLFHGATWILTTDGADLPDLDEVAGIVSSIGANPVTMTAEEHDRAVALVSHLPHLLAAALVEMVAREDSALDLAGGSFRDLTRVAGAESSWWADLLGANARHVGEAISSLEAALASWKTALTENDRAWVGATLDAARERRSGLGEHQARVGVVLFDQPGEIARVGRALEAAQVDVRDFQLRHGEHGGGGVLTITVAPSAESALRGALSRQGFTLQP